MKKSSFLAIAVSLLLGPWTAAGAGRPSHLPVDDARVAAAGIRKLPPSNRLVLYTDLPSTPATDQLPQVFDQAFPQWCAYFHVNPAQQPDWRMTGFLMHDKTRFQQAGLLPAFLPPFHHGFCMSYNLWVYDKPSDYFRCHQVLHEGTHGFMLTMLGSCGPPWYMEGIAEMLATHRLQDGRLTMNYMPASRDETPEWGRIRLIKDCFAARRAMKLQGVIDYPPGAHLELEPYAWCWAAAALLDRHPRYRDRFRELYKYVPGRDFNARFQRLFEPDWQQLAEEWQVFVAGIEYGYDVERTAIDFTPGRPLAAAGAAVRVAADRGWQNSGLRLEAGVNYRLAASGRYQVGTTPRVWWCEPGGVSLRYYQSRPLGILLAAVHPDQGQGSGASVFLRPTVVGLGTTLTPEQPGTLYLKINHSAAELSGNAGELKVEVKRL